MRFRAAELERSQSVLQQQLAKARAELEELEAEAAVLRQKVGEGDGRQQVAMAANERARASEAQRDYLTKEFEAHRLKY